MEKNQGSCLFCPQASIGILLESNVCGYALLPLQTMNVVSISAAPGRSYFLDALVSVVVRDH